MEISTGQQRTIMRKGRFTFHDLPGNSDVGPFDYFVCGWYSIPQMILCT